MEFVSVWDEAYRDLEAETNDRLHVTARVASAPAWPFLANARTRKDFEDRLEYAADRLYQAAEAATRGNPGKTASVYDSLLESLREDFEILAKSWAKPWEKAGNDDDDEEGDKESKSKKDENDSEDENSDEENDDEDEAGKKDKKKSKKSDDDDDDDDDDDKADKKKNPFDKKSSKTAGWVIVNEKSKRRVKGPFPSKPAALDVLKGLGEGYQVEMEKEASLHESSDASDHYMRYGEPPTERPFNWANHYREMDEHAPQGPSVAGDFNGSGMNEQHHTCPTCGR